MSAPTPTQRIFVSHTYSDGAFCSQLVADLRHELGGDETAVWYDASGGLQEGDAWRRELEEEIAARPIFVVVLSPDAVASRRVNDEIDLAWQQKNSPTGKRIIPLLLHACDVPQSLRSLHIVSFATPRPYEDALAELLGALSEEAMMLPELASWSRDAAARRRSGMRRLLWGMLALMVGFYIISFLLALMVGHLDRETQWSLTRPLAGSDVFLLSGLNWYTIITLVLLIVFYLALLRLNIIPRDPFGVRQRARELQRELDLLRQEDARDTE